MMLCDGVCGARRFAVLRRRLLLRMMRGVTLLLLPLPIEMSEDGVNSAMR